MCVWSSELETGYIKLWRALIQKPIWLLSTPEQRSVLIAVLLLANHKGHEWEWSGKKFEVDPGQFVTSLESLRKKSGAGISTQNVRSALRRFEKLEFLTNKATKSGRLISVVNWESYQPKSDRGQQSTQQRGNKDPTPNKNDKNERKNKVDFHFKKLVSIPNDIFFTEKMKAYVLAQNPESESLGEKLFEHFKNWHMASGTKRKNWTRAFYTWVQKDRDEFNPNNYKKKRTYMGDNKPKGY